MSSQQLSLMKCCEDKGEVLISQRQSKINTFASKLQKKQHYFQHDIEGVLTFFGNWGGFVGLNCREYSMVSMIRILRITLANQVKAGF